MLRVAVELELAVVLVVVSSVAVAFAVTNTHCLVGSTVRKLCLVLGPM